MHLAQELKRNCLKTNKIIRAGEGGISLQDEAVNM